MIARTVRHVVTVTSHSVSKLWSWKASVVPVLFCAVGACSSDGGPSEAVHTSYDSAGVHMVSVPRIQMDVLDSGDVWRAVRRVRTGAALSGEEPLVYSPERVMVMPREEIVVLDVGETRLAVIASERDSVTARFARNGRGPGEVLSSASVLAPSTDTTFWLLDPGNSRLSTFTLSGQLLDETRVSLDGGGGMIMQDPTRFVPYLWRFYVVTTSRLLTDSVLKLDLATGRSGVVAPLPDRHPSRRGYGRAAPLLAPLPRFAPLGSGKVVVGRTDQSVFDVYSEDGELERRIALAWEPIELTLAEKQRVLESTAAVGRPQPQRRREVADQLPMWGSIWPLSDDVFAVELSLYARPRGAPDFMDGRKAWILLSSSGEYRGACLVPEGFGGPYWVADGTITGLARDSLGVATIATYSTSDLVHR